jgi:Ion transport protein
VRVVPALGSIDAIRSLLRRIQGAAVCVVTYPAFEHTIMALIAANCVILAMYNPAAPPDSRMALQLETVEQAFNIVFTVEMLLRIVSLGGVYSYLSNPWNMFDATMVLAGYARRQFSGVMFSLCTSGRWKADYNVPLQVLSTCTYRFSKYWWHQVTSLPLLFQQHLSEPLQFATFLLIHLCCAERCEQFEHFAHYAPSPDSRHCAPLWSAFLRHCQCWSRSQLF